jgi:chloramphenicol-sensitive protein RarD
LSVTGKTREGFLYGVTAFGLWGVVPLYFQLFKDVVSPYEVVAQRIVWSAVFLGAILACTRRWGEVARCFRMRALLIPLTITSVLIAVNWLVYILSVYLEKIAESSLGYYILPLASVLIGLVVFGERLRVLQWAALVLAAGGVAWMTVGAGTVPWIALTLAGSFGVYGAIRKTVPVDGLTGLSVETFLLAPFALAYLGWEARHEGLAAVPDRWDLVGLVALSGIVTATPLLCFGQAARRLPLSTMGFLQYIAPSLQLVIALRTESPAGGWTGFMLIWAALAIFTADSLAAYRKAAPSRAEPAVEPEVCET